MIRRLALGLLLTTTWSIASAEFVILDPAAPPQASNTPYARATTPAFSAPRAISQVNQAPAVGSSLRDTLRKVVPSGWKAYADKKLPVETPVDYMPSADWQQSLASLSTRYNLVFKVDPEKKTVSVDQGPGGMRDTNADTRNLAGNTFGKEEAPATMTADGKLRLEIKDGQRLSDAIRQFLQAGKWDLAWEAGSDIEVSKGFVVVDSDLPTVLTAALGRFKMNATLHKGNYIAVVRSNTAAE